MGGLSHCLSRDDSLRPCLWPAKQRFSGRISGHISDAGKFTADMEGTRTLKLLSSCLFDQNTDLRMTLAANRGEG